MENEGKVISEDAPRERPAFITSAHLDKILHFGKLASLNFLILLFLLSLGFLFIFSGYKLLFQYRFFTVFYHIIQAGKFNFSAVSGEVWLWLFLLVGSWASIMAFFGRRV